MCSGATTAFHLTRKVPMTDPLVRDHLAHLTLSGRRPNTLRVRRVILTTYGEHLTARQSTLRAATRHDVIAFLGRDLSAASRKAYRSHLRGFYRWCVEEDVRADDPTAKVPAVRVPRGTPRPLDEDAVAVALHHATPRTRSWLLLMALGGLRCMEVAGLRPADLLSDGRGGTLLFLRECKGGGSATVPAHPAVVEALAGLPIRSGAWWLLTPAQVSRQVGEHLRRCGIDGTAHQLRHSAATTWLRASGHDLLTTARLMRHASTVTTETYAALDLERPTAVVRAVAVAS